MNKYVTTYIRLVTDGESNEVEVQPPEKEEGYSDWSLPNQCVEFQGQLVAAWTWSCSPTPPPKQ